MHTLVRNFAPVKRFNSFPSFEGLFNELEGNTATFPAVNITEEATGFSLALAAPGLKKEDFKVNIHEQTLTISAEVTAQEDEVKPTFTRKEFSYSSFKRVFKLPKTVDSDKIEAAYTDGILTVTLPKKEEEKAKEPKLIEVG